MQPTTTNLVSRGTLLDLIGAAPASHDDRSPSAFDFLLQSPAQSETAPLAPAPAHETNLPRDARPSMPARQSDATDQPDEAQYSSAENSATAQGSADSDDQSPEPAASQKDDEAQGTQPDASDSSDDQTKIDEQVIAESLAGLAAVVTLEVEPPSPVNSDGETEPLGAELISTADDEGAVASVTPNIGDQPHFEHAAAVGAEIPRAVPTNVPTNGVEVQNAPAGKTKALAHDQPLAVAESEPAAKTAGSKDGEQQSWEAGLSLEQANDYSKDTDDDAAKTAQHDAEPSVNRATEATISLDAPKDTSKPDQTPVVVAGSAASLTEVTHAVSQTSDSAALPATTVVAPQGPTPRSPSAILGQATNPSARPATGHFDGARLLNRVVRAFSAAQEREGEVRLRLSPPELGSLRLDVRIHEGALAAHLQTETAEARTAILDNLPVLRERLAEQGIRIERFDVDLMQRQPGGMPDQTGGHQQEPAAPVRLTPSPRPRPSAATAGPTTLGVNTTNGLNVII